MAEIYIYIFVAFEGTAGWEYQMSRPLVQFLEATQIRNLFREDKQSKWVADEGDNRTMQKHEIQ
jgi:hypothetical protein